MPENKPFKPGTGYKRPTLSKSEMATIKKEVSKAKPVVTKLTGTVGKSTSSSKAPVKKSFGVTPSGKKVITTVSTKTDKIANKAKEDAAYEKFLDQNLGKKGSNTYNYVDPRTGKTEQREYSNAHLKDNGSIATKAPSTGVPSSVRDMQRMGRTAKELNIKPKEGMGIIEYMAPTGVGSSATSVLKGLTSEPVVSATKAALETPLPLGNAVTRATSGALTPSNIISTYVKASSIKNLADPNSDTRKSVKKAIKNPTLDNVVNAGINTGIDVAGAGIMPKSSKYVLKGTKYGAKARPLLTKAAVLGNDFFNKLNK